MAASKPIDINSLDEDTLAVARAAAESAGMTLEDWLARTLGDTAQGDQSLADPYDAPHDRADAPAEPVDPTGMAGAAASETGQRGAPDSPGGTGYRRAPEIDPDATVIGTAPQFPAHEPAQARSRQSDWQAAPPAGQRAGTGAPTDLKSAVQALAASLATSTTDPAWAIRIDSIRRGVAPPPQRAQAADTRPTPQPLPESPRDRRDSAPATAKEPKLEPPQDVPPAPIIGPDPDEPESNGSSNVFTDSELEKAIAAAQERRRQADSGGKATRSRRATGGWITRILLGLLVLLAIAIIAVLAYAWVTPSTSIDEIIEDLTAQASSVFGDAEAPVDESSEDGAPDDGVVPAEPDAAPEPPPEDDSASVAPDPATTDTADAATPAADPEPASQPAAPPQPDGTTAVLQPPPDTPSTSSPPPEIASLQTRAEAGDPVSQRELGLRYLSGEGVAEDPEAAYLWLEEAAVGSDPDAQYILGTMLESGTGTEADPLIAMAWYMSAAEAGKPEANLRLGEIYRDGELWPQSYADAADRFRAAADAGSAEAEFELAQLYSAGYGVDRSPLLAHAWYSRAAEHGHPGAAARMDTIAATLSAEQLAQSAELAANPPATDTTLYGESAQEPGEAAGTAPASPDGTNAPLVSETPAPDQPQSSDSTAAQPPADPAEPTVGNPGVTGTNLAPVIGPDGALTIDAAGTATTDEDSANGNLPVSQLSTAAIQEIQTLLNTLGYESGRPDGIPGRRTEAAIRAYQEAQGLPITGEPSLSLLARLRGQAG